jgi:hypothetical protein
MRALIEHLVAVFSQSSLAAKDKLTTDLARVQQKIK